MKLQTAPSQPWVPDETRYAMRGRAIVRLRAGEVPRSIPNHHDVMAGAALAAPRVDVGRLDQVLRRFSPAARITRSFEAARNVGRLGQRHEGWDDLEVTLGLSRTLRIEVDPDAPVIGLVDALRELAVVETATPHFLAQAPFAAPRTADAPAARPQTPDPWYGFDLVGGGRALAMEPGDSALIVAIVDSGVALNHEEFEGRLRPGIDTVDMPEAQVSRALRIFGDTTGRDRIPMDEMGHGTGCAGIIGARGKRVAPGLAGAARVLPARALAGALVTGRHEPTAIGGLPDIDAAVKLAVDLGARVLNLSFGTPESALGEGELPPHAEVVDYALRRGCVLVSASGNSGDWTRYFPAALPGVIAVGSVGPTGRPSTFTTRGVHVALSAPGERIYGPGLVGYQENTGTSFAAPFVTAACALLVARAAGYSTPLQPETVRRVLMSTVARFPAESDAQGCGVGILDVPAALRALDEVLLTPPDGRPAVEPPSDREPTRMEQDRGDQRQQQRQTTQGATA